ncbi:MAG TPA: hypothetical protein VHW68_12620 [Actinomycetota bacterium]|jgi:hypothetical protein|nr:hypothetical protein [Actinomycetota bacterium]
MGPSKTRAVASLGAIAGAATIVGVALPWVKDASDRGAGLSINGLIAGPWVMVFGVVMAGASLFLLADVDPRKVVAILGPTSLGVLAYVMPVILNKEAALFGGLAQVFTERGIGLYVCLVGGILGLVAVGVAAKELTSRSAQDMDAPSGFDLGDVSEPRD